MRTTIWSLSLGLPLSVLTLAGCGVATNSQRPTESTAAQSTAAEAPAAPSNDETPDDESYSQLSLAGLGDRVCRLEFSFVRKDADGNFKVVGRGATSDGEARTGVGRGCLDFCSSAFSTLRSINASKGVDVLLKSCKFDEQGGSVASASSSPRSSSGASPVASTQPAVASPIASANPTQAAPQPVAAPTPTPTPFLEQKQNCSVLQADLQVILSVQSTRPECLANCSKFEATNPSRRCDWGTETLRDHPLNQCSIVGSGGKVHFSQRVTRFHCRMECKARATTNPERSCTWGGENVREN